MNPSQKNHHKPKHLKKRLSQDQVRLLEASFDPAKKLESERKLQLASELGVPPRQIAIWYQNKRARWKNQSLELHYGALQQRLDAALAEKRQLEEEAERLRRELKRARDMLMGFKWARSQEQAHQGSAPPASFYNDGIGDVASGGAPSQIDDVYGCFMLDLDGETHDIFYSKP